MRKSRDDTINIQVIKELAKIRNNSGISKKALSEMTGLSRRGIQLIEEGQRNPTLLSLLKISHALNTELGQVISKIECSVE